MIKHIHVDGEVGTLPNPLHLSSTILCRGNKKKKKKKKINKLQNLLHVHCFIAFGFISLMNPRAFELRDGRA